LYRISVTMWSTWGETAKASLTQAFEKTGDALTKAASQAGPSKNPQGAANESTRMAAEEATTSPKVTGRYGDESNEIGSSNSNSTKNSSTDQKEHVLKHLQAGWTSVVQQTKASINKAEEAVKTQQTKLQERLNKARVLYYKRDPSLPLDVAALKDAEVVYITDRIITMSHPAMSSAVDGEITGERKLAAIGHMLTRRHNGRYMVWNLSEVEYDCGILDEQVLTFSFPGSPSPPLGLLLKLLVSMEAWLKADDRNVAVVHCLTGKGRTSTVLAAFLCWMGQAGFTNIYDTLEYIARCKQITPDELTIPSQRRYASYFKNMLDGVRPSQPPLMLTRIILSEAPKYAKGPLRPDDDNNKKTAEKDPEVLRMGCAPYLQLFKAGQLLHTAPASLHFQQASDELPFCQVADGSISFHVNQIVQGDILIRCRHLTASRQRVSMFRAAFHTGYVPPNVMRLTKAQLDGACSDHRFPDDFFLDIIFETVDAEQASQVLEQQEQDMMHKGTVASDDHPAVETGANAAAADLAGGATKVSASVYDTMLSRDSRFWDVIAARQKEHHEESHQDEPQNHLWGSTVGRRREFGKKKSRKEDDKKPDKGPAKLSSLESFSIGSEFDFLPTPENELATSKPASGASTPKPTIVALPPKKDSLMEALMGALDEPADNEDERGTEEIVFEEESSGGYASETSSMVPSVSSSVGGGNELAKPSGTAFASTSSEAPSISVDTVAKKDQAPAADIAASNEDGNDDVDDLLNIDDDMDMDALLSGTDGLDDIDGDLLDLDVDDAELEDLENFLSPGKK
jgi:hypothetical protein